MLGVGKDKSSRGGDEIEVVVDEGKWWRYSLWDTAEHSANIYTPFFRLGFGVRSAGTRTLTTEGPTNTISHHIM